MQGIFEFIKVSIFTVKDILWSWNDRVQFEVDVKIYIKMVGGNRTLTDRNVID